MNEQLDKKLCEDYPKIFCNRYKSPQETCMHWGFEVGDGWYNLINTLCEALTYTFTTSIEIDEEDAKSLGVAPSMWENHYFFKVEAPQVIADQVKEKFGTLRFYYHLEYSDDINKLAETNKYPELQDIIKRYTDYIDGIIHFAEIASGRTCSVSGTEGRMHVRNGWFKVLNDSIAKKEPYYIGYEPYNKTKTKDQ